MRMNRLNALLVPVLLLWVAAGIAQTPNRAAVASANPLASEAGIEVLEQGGNAFDAAVAVSAALGVVEPYGSGFGGGGFFLLHRAADGLQVMIDGRETAPGAADEDMYLDEVGDPGGQHPGLAASGAGEHKQRSINMGRGLELSGIQFASEVHSPFPNGRVKGQSIRT